MENKIFKGAISYSPDTGKFVWLKPTSNRVKAGSEIGDKNVRYEYVNIDNKRYFLHRVAVELVTGMPIPAGMVVDHVNQDTHDNRYCNLRIVSESDNARNKPKRRDNKSGVTGVCFENSTSRWRAYIVDDTGKVVKLGSFKTEEEAISARLSKQKEFNYHRNHGINESKNEYRSR